MVSLVFSGGLIPVTGRAVFDQLSWAIPARWGFAASASTTDLHTIAPLVHSNETLWMHQIGRWLLDMTLLILLGAVLAGYARWHIGLNMSRTGNWVVARQWRRVSMWYLGDIMHSAEAEAKFQIQGAPSPSTRS
jgi:hypothetical protein